MFIVPIMSNVQNSINFLKWGNLYTGHSLFINWFLLTQDKVVLEIYYSGERRNRLVVFDPNFSDHNPNIANLIFYNSKIVLQVY